MDDISRNTSGLNKNMDAEYVCLFCVILKLKFLLLQRLCICSFKYSMIKTSIVFYAYVQNNHLLIMFPSLSFYLRPLLNLYAHKESWLNAIISNLFNCYIMPWIFCLLFHRYFIKLCICLLISLGKFLS